MRIYQNDAQPMAGMAHRPHPRFACDIWLQALSGEYPASPEAHASGLNSGIFLVPIPGISLIGFMDERQALHQLRTNCVLDDGSEAVCAAIWQKACKGIGAAPVNAGQPEILPIPSTHTRQVALLREHPWMRSALSSHLRGASFQLVEIDPLLSFQFGVMTDGPARLCQTLGKPPTLDELFPVCFPTTHAAEPLQVHRQAQSLLVKAKNQELSILHQGSSGVSSLSIGIGISMPLAHVVRWQGRCYLNNGFHRAVGIRQAGGTHMPCIVREVATAVEVGIREDDSTFRANQLTGPNPPTLGHFLDGSATQVQLRARSRVLHIAWSEYLVYDE